MSLNPLALIEFILPKTETPEDLRSWRGKVAALLILIVLALCLSPLGLETRYMSRAAADEIHEEIKEEVKKIQVTTEGVKKEVENLQKSFKNWSDMDRARAIQDLRTQILGLQSRICQTPTGELRNELVSQMERLRSRYMEMVGDEFPVFTCRDLIGRDRAPGEG